MKEKSARIISVVIMAVFMLGVCVLTTLVNNRAEGAWYLYAVTAAYTLIFVAAVIYIIMFFVGLKKTDSWAYIIFYCISIPVFLFGTNATKYYKDVFSGSVVCTTDVYKVPVTERYVDFPNVHFSCEGKYLSLYISEETYAILAANPYNENEIVIDEALNEKTHPHINVVEIEFYPNTHILREVRIINE